MQTKEKLWSYNSSSECSRGKQYARNIPAVSKHPSRESLQAPVLLSKPKGAGPCCKDSLCRTDGQGEGIPWVSGTAGKRRFCPAFLFDSICPASYLLLRWWGGVGWSRLSAAGAAHLSGESHRLRTSGRSPWAGEVGTHLLRDMGSPSWGSLLRSCWALQMRRVEGCELGSVAFSLLERSVWQRNDSAGRLLSCVFMGFCTARSLEGAVS